MAFLEYTPRQTLFQYCSPTAFKGIISSKSLWFSDITTSNDPRELKFGFNNILSAIAMARREVRDPKIATLVHELSERLTYQYNNIAVFCACLSLAVDALPMWNEYGGSTRGSRDGMAIGFRATALNDMPVRIQKVRYIQPGDERNFGDLLLELAERVDKFGETSADRVKVRSLTAAFVSMTAIKHSTWDYENEVRAIYCQEKVQHSVAKFPHLQQTSQHSDGTPVWWTGPLERQGRNATVKYLSFKYGRKCGDHFDASGAIEKVVLGQNCALSQDYVQSALHTLGFRSFSIIKSDCVMS